MSRASAISSQAQLLRPYAGNLPTTLREQRDRENRLALGGMRRPDVSIQKCLPEFRDVGDQVGRAFLQMAKEHSALREIVQNIRRGLPAAMPLEIAREARRRLSEVPSENKVYYS